MKEGLEEQKGKNIHGNSLDAGIFHYTVKMAFFTIQLCHRVGMFSLEIYRLGLLGLSRQKGLLPPQSLTQYCYMKITFLAFPIGSTCNFGN